MDRREFLDVLRQSLNGEVSSDVIEQNIRYYDQYIGSQSPEEESKIIEMLGDPRLLAKTVIETDKAAKQKGKLNESYDNGSYSGKYTGNEEGPSNKNRGNHGQNIFNVNLNWRQKLTLILVLMVIIVVIVFIGRIIIGFLFAFGVPLLLVALLFALFRKRN